MDDKHAADAAAQDVEPGPVATAGPATRAPEPVQLPVRAPSKPWVGGVILACLTLAAVWVLTYTLAPLPGQRALGGWNYAAAGALLTGFVSMARRWHGEPPRRTTKP